MEDSACENFSDDPVEIVYDNSMLAVTKSNGHIVENNPLAFSLRFWESSVDIVPSSDTSNEPINDIVDIESIEYVSRIYSHMLGGGYTYLLMGVDQL
jgi:hypothetical protein